MMSSCYCFNRKWVEKHLSQGADISEFAHFSIIEEAQLAAEGQREVLIL
jgi:hypothetical protein